jgi:hypothetical protein
MIFKFWTVLATFFSHLLIYNLAYAQVYTVCKISRNNGIKFKSKLKLIFFFYKDQIAVIGLSQKEKVLLHHGRVKNREII